ncbi:MAG: lipopolysaccharide biosynthesis protein [Alteromonadaceae bacterium]|nr:lipopolysaccharide biosynthesis protein [Alteromonadaceae bacterium]
MLVSIFERYKKLNWAVIDQGLVSGSNFFTGIVIARLLGLEMFGRFTLIWLVIQFLASIQESLLLGPMVTIGPKIKAKDGDNYYFGMFTLVLLFSLLASFIVFIVGSLVDFLYPQFEIHSFLIPLVVTLFFFLLQDFFRRYFYSKEMTIAALINDVISYVGQALLLLFLFFLEPTIHITDVLFIIALTSALAVIVSIILNKKIRLSFQCCTFQCCNDAWKRNWHLAKWMVSSAIANWFTNNLFMVMVGAYLGNFVVGAMKAAQNLMGIHKILFQIIENIVPVRAGKVLIDSGIKAMVRYFTQVTIVCSCVIGVFSLVIVVFSQQIMKFVYGPEYTQFSWLLVAYVIIYFLIFLMFPLRIILRTLEHAKYIFVSYLISALFSLLCSQYLVQSTGLEGAMLGLFGANLIMFFTLVFYARKRLKNYKDKHLI